MSPSFLAPLILTVLGVQITCSNGNPETGQCNVSEINGINRTVGDKDHYETGGSVSVWCSPGYDPRNKTITCRSNGMSVMWDDPVPCTERCKESDLSRDIRVHLVPLQDYYPPNTEVSVRCPLGYKPSHKTITCKAQHGHNVWDEAVIRCVAISLLWSPCPCLAISLLCNPCTCSAISLLCSPCSCSAISLLCNPCTCSAISLLCNPCPCSAISLLCNPCPCSAISLLCSPCSCSAISLLWSPCPCSAISLLCNPCICSAISLLCSS
ncbi:hypothetical protein XELAEV_18004011mg [Xenopus laevis]|uniref:Sushi domain-containing protein n=1 Tax=Xenopus laevis TaxID=8355 RepID=A0A974BRR3_XENLA|nr:hypothetical protein XELAEV_18004011mg [Xenopus laevis]